MNKEDTIKQIAKMIASGEIPKEVYDKYLSKCPIGFMKEEELFDYLFEVKELEPIEIIEEEKDIEELPIIKNADKTTSLQGKDYNYTMKTVDVILANKINELVREIRKLKEK